MDNKYNYGYCGNQKEAIRETRNFYITIGTCALSALILYGCIINNKEEKSKERVSQINNIEKIVK